jgi:hypothetical protein
VTVTVTVASGGTCGALMLARDWRVLSFAYWSLALKIMFMHTTQLKWPITEISVFNHIYLTTARKMCSSSSLMSTVRSFIKQM